MPTVAAVAPSGVVVAGLSAGDEASEVPVTLWDGDYVTLQDEQLIPASDAPQRHSSGKGSAPAVGVVHCAERGRALVVAHGVCWCWTLRLATNARTFLARRLPSHLRLTLPLWNRAKPLSLRHALGRLRGAQRYLADAEVEAVAGQQTIAKLGNDHAPNAKAFSRELTAYLSTRASGTGPSALAHTPTLC